MQPCAPLPRVRDGRLQSLISNHVATAQAYHECAEAHDNLIAVVRTMQRNSAPQRAEIRHETDDLLTTDDDD